MNDHTVNITCYSFPLNFKPKGYWLLKITVVIAATLIT